MFAMEITDFMQVSNWHLGQRLVAWSWMTPQLVLYKNIIYVQFEVPILNFLISFLILFKLSQVYFSNVSAFYYISLISRLDFALVPAIMLQLNDSITPTVPWIIETSF